MTNKRCKDWCDTFASVYPVKSYCSDECKSAGRSVNEKDKPEAGRTCCDLHRMTGKDDNRCLWILPNGDATDVNPAARPEPAGLYRKFTVERTNGSSGPGGKHEHCDYFVLDWMHDKFAVPAALAYAKACEAEYPELARDLRERAGMAVAHAEPARKVPMNPAPRPVEQVHSSNCPEGYAGQAHDGKECCEPAEPTPRAPRPVERCSCAEATRYKTALELLERYMRMDLLHSAGDTAFDAIANELVEVAGLGDSPTRYERLERIARRALVLGGENDNE